MSEFPTIVWSVSDSGITDTDLTPLRNLLCSQYLGKSSAIGPMWKTYIISPENDNWIEVEDAAERKRSLGPSCTESTQEEVW